jgi:predicted DNA-binding transcriptional regulator AlpA
MRNIDSLKAELLPPSERAKLEDLYGKVIGPIIDAKLEAKAQELLARQSKNLTQVLSELLGPDDRDARLISRQSAAELLGVSLSTIKRMEASGELPEPIKFGEHTVRHRLIDVEAIARTKLLTPVLD